MLTPELVLVWDMIVLLKLADTCLNLSIEKLISSKIISDWIWKTKLITNMDQLFNDCFIKFVHFLTAGCEFVSSFVNGLHLTAWYDFVSSIVIDYNSNAQVRVNLKTFFVCRSWCSGFVSVFLFRNQQTVFERRKSSDRSWGLTHFDLICEQCPWRGNSGHKLHALWAAGPESRIWRVRTVLLLCIGDLV